MPADEYILIATQQQSGSDEYQTPSELNE